jgi:hypothetical protein
LCFLKLSYPPCTKDNWRRKKEKEGEDVLSGNALWAGCSWNKAPWLLTQAGPYLPNAPLLGHYLPHSVHMPKIRHVKTVSNSLHIQHTSFALPSTPVMELLFFSYNFSFFGQAFKIIKLTTLFRLLTHFLYIHKNYKHLWRSSLVRRKTK